MQDLTYLTRAKFTDKLWEILKEASIDNLKYVSYSFWSGAAIIAAEFNISDVHIKMHTKFMLSQYQKSWLLFFVERKGFTFLWHINYSYGN